MTARSSLFSLSRPVSLMLLLSLRRNFLVFYLLLRRWQINCLESLLLIHVIQNGVYPCFALWITLVPIAVHFHELFNSQIAATDPDHNTFTLNLHDHALPMVLVNTFWLTGEGHPRPERQRMRIDIRAQFDVDRVRSYRLISDCFLFFLHFNDNFIFLFHLLHKGARVSWRLFDLMLTLLDSLLSLITVVLHLCSCLDPTLRLNLQSFELLLIILQKSDSWLQHRNLLPQYKILLR